MSQDRQDRLPQPSVFLSFALAVAPAVFIFCLQGCPGAIPQPNPPPDATDAAHTPDASLSSFAAACAGLKNAGCVTLDDCAAVLAQTQGDVRFKQYNLNCLAHSLTPSDVAVCGATCTPVDQ
jgi:hypothetical protein